MMKRKAYLPTTLKPKRNLQSSTQSMILISLIGTAMQILRTH